MIFSIFHDFPGQENGLPKLHDFPQPGGTLQYRETSKISRKLILNYLHHCLHVLSDKFIFKNLRHIHTKLETKPSSHQGQCRPAGYCHAHMLLYVSGVNYNVNSKYTKYFAQLCGRISTFRKISTTN